MEKIGIWLSSWNTHGTMWIWLIPFALFTLYASLKMVTFAELIIQKTKLGGAFVGLVFVSFITSIPELITEISQGILGKPDVGISDDIGSNAFSMFAISVVILVFIKKLSFKNLSKLTIVTIILSFTLSFILIFILKYKLDYAIGKKGLFIIGISPLIFLFGYIGFVMYTYKYRHLADKEPRDKIKTNLKIKQIYIMFVIFAILLIVSALFLNWVVNAMQIKYGISSKSAGGVLLSITTSLPEIIALITFAKSGFITAAIGSIVGSHIFNLSAIFWGDVSFTENASILATNIEKLTPLAALAALEIFLFIIFILVSKKTNNKIVLSIIPTIIIIVYIVAWALMLTIWR